MLTFKEDSISPLLMDLSNYLENSTKDKVNISIKSATKSLLYTNENYPRMVYIKTDLQYVNTIYDILILVEWNTKTQKLQMMLFNDKLYNVLKSDTTFYTTNTIKQSLSFMQFLLNTYPEIQAYIPLTDLFLLAFKKGIL